MRILDKIKEKFRRYTLSNGYVCDGCGAELFDYPTHRLCERCERDLTRNDKEVCPKCGRQTTTLGICLTCKGYMPKFTAGYTPFVYRAEVAALVNRLKNGAPRLALYFGEEMAECFFKRCEQISTFQGENAEELLVLPVPVTKAKRLERGYNQAEELAKRICERLQEQGVHVKGDFCGLEKAKDTLQQKHMDALSRRKNVEGAYHIKDRKRFKGKSVLLVDDIMTTGSTASECSERLLAAGAKQVFFLVAAALPERK